MNDKTCNEKKDTKDYHPCGQYGRRKIVDKTGLKIFPDDPKPRNKCARNEEQAENREKQHGPQVSGKDENGHENSIPVSEWFNFGFPPLRSGPIGYRDFDNAKFTHQCLDSQFGFNFKAG